jgi:hypothetical protein
MKEAIFIDEQTTKFSQFSDYFFMRDLVKNFAEIYRGSVDSDK